MDHERWWSIVQASMRAFSPFYQEAMRQAIQDSGVADHWFPLSLARALAPQPLTVDRFHGLYPYTARDECTRSLEVLAQAEMLERVGGEAYRLTDLGQETVEGIFGAAHDGMLSLLPLPAGEMERLNGLLGRLVEASLAAPEPLKWSILTSRWTDPGEGAAPSVKTDQYLTDLVRFRDDAHLAAFAPHGVSGHAWEALTFVWRDQARTASELADQLSFRSHSAEMYAQAMQQLAGRGWLEHTAEGYRITESGATLRQEAEEATDRFFFGPWDCLDAAEQAELRDLLIRLQSRLDEMAQEREAAG